MQSSTFSALVVFIQLGELILFKMTSPDGFQLRSVELLSETAPNSLLLPIAIKSHNSSSNSN